MERLCRSSGQVLQFEFWLMQNRKERLFSSVLQKHLGLACVLGID